MKRMSVLKIIVGIVGIVAFVGQAVASDYCPRLGTVKCWLDDNQSFEVVTDHVGPKSSYRAMFIFTNVKGGKGSLYHKSLPISVNPHYYDESLNIYATSSGMLRTNCSIFRNGPRLSVSLYEFNDKDSSKICMAKHFTISLTKEIYSERVIGYFYGSLPDAWAELTGGKTNFDSELNCSLTDPHTNGERSWDTDTSYERCLRIAEEEYERCLSERTRKCEPKGLRCLKEES